jgi:hypothetical protein
MKPGGGQIYFHKKFSKELALDMTHGQTKDI